MAKCKYEKDFPLKAEEMARDGMIDKDIAVSLGISEETFYQYLKKFPEFSEALKRGKSPVNVKVENALLKRALGYEYTEKTIEAIVDSKGNASGQRIKTTTKHIPSDTTAMIFWLKNRKPNAWADRQEVNLKAETTKITLEFE